MTYTVIYEEGPASWGAYVPDLPGVFTVGDSREEVESLIREAIQFHIEGLIEESGGHRRYRCCDAFPVIPRAFTSRS